MPAALPTADTIAGKVADAATLPIPARPDSLYSLGFKRLGDLVIGLVLLIGLAPLMLATAVLVWLLMGRPILFLDRRSGRDGVPFTLMKFRSMLPVGLSLGKQPSVSPPSVAAAMSTAGSEAFQASDADRLTPFGRFLRRTSLDELPQLFNVVVGDMSLVGPRPLPERYLSRYSSRESARLLVRPGLTGWAQIHGRNSLGWPQRLEMDVRYVEMLSRWYAPIVDLWIIACTAIQVVLHATTGRSISSPGEATMPEYNPAPPSRAAHNARPPFEKPFETP